MIEIKPFTQDELDHYRGTFTMDNINAALGRLNLAERVKGNVVRGDIEFVSRKIREHFSEKNKR